MGYTITEYHGSYNRTKRTATIKYIVVHYTGSGSSASGNALANCKYFAGGDRQASAHYFIDDASIYEYLDPSEYAAWHCGGGSGPVYNSNSIGIEVCAKPYQTDPFTDEEISRLTWLTQKLMGEYDIPASNVVRHYDVTGKKCPYPYIPTASNSWDELLATITGSVVDAGTGAVYRLRHPSDGNCHMFTASLTEANTCVSNGWVYEDVGWVAPTSGTKVYRLYNPYATSPLHLWTTDTNERDTLVGLGWNNEGVAFYSGGSVAVYRLNNPYDEGNHHYTVDKNEYQTLVAAGWTGEGTAFYASSAS